MDAAIFPECVRATVSVAVCKTILRVVRSWFPRLFVAAHNPLGGCAKLADYVAVASSLSPPQ